MAERRNKPPTPRSHPARGGERDEIARLRRRLAEVEQSLSAIRSGEVDALVVSGPRGEQVYTLKDAEYTYRLIIEKMLEGTITVDSDGLILYTNPQFARMLGVGHDGLLGTPIFEHVPDSGHPDLKLLLAAGLTAGVAGEVEFAGNAGKKIFTRVSLSPLRIEGIQALSCIVSDVTEAKQAEEARSRLASIVEQAIDGVVVLDPAGDVLYANAACASISGYPLEEFMRLKIAVLPEDVQADIRTGLAKDGFWKGAIVRTRKDGSSVELGVSVAPLKAGGPEISSLIVFFRDVTEAMEMERKIRRMEQTEALGRLAGGVAHDMNNILQPIILNAELMLGDADPQTPEYAMLRNVLQAAHRQRDLVRKILSFTRRTKGALRPLHLIPLLDEALGLVRPSLSLSIDVRRHVDAAADTILGDPTELHEVVSNLCTNAADAMQATGGILEISLANAVFDVEEPALDLKPGTYTKLTVKDSGCGIPAYDLKRIFDPFFTTKAPGKGSGIGLSVVGGIVKSHGGAIAIESVVGQGTRVDVYFPTVDDVPVPAVERIREKPAKAVGLRILLVDDEEMVLESMRQALRILGHKPTAVEDAATALSLFRLHPERFDLALLDQTMPVMGGLELAKGLLEIKPGFPIVLATGYSSVFDESSLLATGIREVVMKPLNLAALAAAVARVR